MGGKGEHTFTRGGIMLILSFRMIPTFFGFVSVYVLQKLGLDPPWVPPVGEPEISPVSEAIPAASGSILLWVLSLQPASQGTGSGSPEPQHFLTMENIILDGLFMSVVVSDVVLAKMAHRELHPWIIIMCFARSLPLTNFLTLFMIAFYYVAVLADLCWHLNLPLLSPIRNVYCDGVFDLCHVGHKTLFRGALKHGNRLFVGVCGDADCAVYKRPPVMTHG